MVYIILTLGLYLKIDLCMISVYSGFLFRQGSLSSMFNIITHLFYPTFQPSGIYQGEV